MISSSVPKYAAKQMFSPVTLLATGHPFESDVIIAHEGGARLFEEAHDCQYMCRFSSIYRLYSPAILFISNL